MNKAYLTPRLFKVLVTFPYERTSYAEPTSHSHWVGGGDASHSEAWARHIGKVAAGHDGTFEIFEYDCGDWIKVVPEDTWLDQHQYDGEIPF